MNSLPRVYHPYSLWEDHQAGMWQLDESPESVAGALQLMQDTDSWRTAMEDMVFVWKYSAEHNLTNLEQNRVAWLGQAAICYRLGIPASATRRAWWQLSKDQQDAANSAAERTIRAWEEWRLEEMGWHDIQRQLMF